MRTSPSVDAAGDTLRSELPQRGADKFEVRVGEQVCQRLSHITGGTLGTTIRALEAKRQSTIMVRSSRPTTAGIIACTSASNVLSDSTYSKSVSCTKSPSVASLLPPSPSTFI